MIFARYLRRAARILRWPTAALMPLTTSAALACSTMVLGLPERPIVAYSFDFDATGAGFMVVNPNGATRRSIMDGAPAVWSARHASVTFNQIGPGMPAVGMNTAGLVVSMMWNSKAVYSRDGNTPVVNELEFIQRLLDTAGSVDEALASLQDVRIEGMVPIHYLLADRFGTTAAVTPTPTGLLIHTGDEMPVPALTNTSYAELMEKITAYDGFGGKKPLPSGLGEKDPGSLERFALAASASRGVGSVLAADTAFDVLDDVANRETRWQIVFDPSGQQIAFRIVGQEGLHVLEMPKLDFSCLDRPLAVELSDLTPQDVPDVLTPIDPPAAGNVARQVLGSFSKAGFPPDVADGLVLGLLGSVTCDT